MRYRFWMQWKDERDAFDGKTYLENGSFDLLDVKDRVVRMVSLTESGIFAGAFHYLLYDTCTYTYLDISKEIEEGTTYAKTYLTTRSLDDLFPTRRVIENSSGYRETN